MENNVKRTKEMNLEIIANSLSFIAAKLASLEACINVQTEMEMERFRVEIGTDKLENIFTMIEKFKEENKNA